MLEIHIHRQPLSLLLAVTSTLIVIAFWYFRGWFRFRSSSPTETSLLRLVLFICGIVTVWIGTESAFATLDHQSLTIHMLKHLLLMTVAAPLLLAGAPASVFAGRKVGKFEFHCSDLVLCWLAGTATVIAWHLPVAFQLAMRSRWVHGTEDVSFLVAGLLFWSPIAGSWSSAISEPRWEMSLYLFLATLPCDVLSAFLVFCNRVVYSHYLSMARPSGMSPLQDQERAGALMWVWVTFVYLVPAILITLQMLSPSDRTSSVALKDTRIL